MSRRALNIAILGVSISITGAAAVWLGSSADPARLAESLAEGEARAETGGAIADVEGPPRRVLLANPGFDGWAPEHRGPKLRWRSAPSPGFDALAIPTDFFTAVYDRVERPRRTIGRVRRGVSLSVRKVDTTITCHDNGERGVWYAIEGGGVLCSTSGFDIVDRATPLDPPQKMPALDQPMPFRYARVVDQGAPLLSRPFTLAQYEALKSVGGPRDDPTGLMVERLVGDHFLSVDTTVDVGGVSFTRTVHNQFVETSALKPRPQPRFRGERLAPGRPFTGLPLAFVWGDDTTPVLCEDRSPCGVVEKHARFRPQETVRVDGEAYVEGPGGILVPSRAVRVARLHGRPGGIGPDDPWVHIDLDEQTVVAYEGDTPMYASLVSSGKEGYETPTGLYRMTRKFLSKRMRAVDEIEGLYSIEDIPYVMYYYGSYAIHGAYWHDVFGQTRSHGCTNLAPADARWIYHWSKPTVPDTWHAVENIERGLGIYFSRAGSKHT